MQSDIVQRLQPILRRNGWGNVKEYSRHIPFILEREGLCIVETSEIARLTEALRKAEERGKALLAVLEYIRSGLPVLKSMLHTLRMYAGAKQVGLMIAAISAALKDHPHD